ncbi:MAG: sensor histidine kinase [Bacteroidia bacterium]
MSFKKRAYWLFQVGGWLLLFSIGLINRELDQDLIKNALVYAVFGILLSHLLRMSIILSKILETTNIKIIGVTIANSLLFGHLFFLVRFFYVLLVYNEQPPYDLMEVLNISFYFLVWQILYVGYSIIEKNRKEELNNLRLIALNNEIELRHLKAQINPHFMFNALNSVKALIDEDAVKAKEAVFLISNILRASLLSDKKELTTIQEELELIKNYLGIEKIRFENRLNVSYNVDENLLAEKVPPFIIQLLVENAVKHGISKRIQPGEISISIRKIDDSLEIKVENDISQINKPIDSTGTGLENLKKRLHLLYGNNANFEFSINEKAAAKILIPIKL